MKVHIPAIGGGARAAWLIGDREMRRARDGVHAREGMKVLIIMDLGRA